MKTKALYGIISKGKNFRVKISLHEEENGHKFFFLETRRLIDFKTRNITTVQNVFSVETFAVLAGTSNFFMEHPEIKNKVLLKELNKLVPARSSTNLKIK